MFVAPSFSYLYASFLFFWNTWWSPLRLSIISIRTKGCEVGVLRDLLGVQGQQFGGGKEGGEADYGNAFRNRGAFRKPLGRAPGSAQPAIEVGRRG